MEGGGGSTSISCLMGTFGEENINNNNNNNNNNNSDSDGGGGGFCPMIMMPPPVGSGGVGSSSMMLHHMNTITSTGYYFMDVQRNNTDADDDDDCSLKAKIMAHPHYNRLLAAYLNCQKIGAPPEVVARLEELACSSSSSSSSAMGGRHSSSSSSRSCVGEDPALDQFMEAYCEMLIKYEQELSKPFKEAMLFLSRIDSHFKALNLQSPHHHSSSSAPAGCGEAMERNGGNSSDDEFDVNNNLIDPQAEDRQLKGQLLRKYSGYLGSLKQEFMKKRKKGKLPKEARQQLLDWWSRHYKWPYPSESQKLALAESTGLDQKQINNWFINQRKRHWKPSEDMQFVVMDATHPGHYYMDNVLGNNPFAMDISPTLL